MIVDYSSDEDDNIISKKNDKNQKSKQQNFSISINPIPEADITDMVNQQKEQELELYKLQNPELFEDKSDNHVTGRVQKIAKNDEMNVTTFDEQQRNFQNYGFAYDPSLEDETKRIIVNENLCPELYEKIKNGEQLQENDIKELQKKAYGLKKKEEQGKTKDLKEKRENFGWAGDADFQGPWAAYNDEQVKKIELTEEDKKRIQKVEEARKEKLQEEKIENEQRKYTKTTTEYHGDELRDYQGRSYLAPPADLKIHEQNSYIPKKCIKIYKGHEKGVQCIKFFPKFGHFLLSASLDSTVKLWSTTGQKNCVRTYMGHNQAVRDIGFTNDGRHFISAGYDKNINYWDTETGKIVNTIKIKAFPYSVKMHPDDRNQHSFILGSSNKKIFQYDLRTGNRTQTYDEHLGAINTITFFHNSRYFISTSDDKKIFVWEYGIPVVVKHIAEPDMHSVHATSVSPNYQYLAAQQANNKIAIYDLKGGNLRLNRKKVFQGHQAAGYAVGMSFSGDGKYLCSGDSEGRAFFWDWKTCKTYRAIDAHDGVCIDVAWHPNEGSKVATCGWDGLIKYWD